MQHVIQIGRAVCEAANYAVAKMDFPLRRFSSFQPVAFCHVTGSPIGRFILSACLLTFDDFNSPPGKGQAQFAYFGGIVCHCGAGARTGCNPLKNHRKAE
jgi:hypothetical protein